MYHCDYFDLWGKGTTVTVTSGPTPTPSLFPVVQCKTGGEVTSITLGCLAHDFNPGSTFKWTPTSLTHVQYPAAVQGSKYTGLSVVQVPKSSWESEQSFNCSLTYPGGTLTEEIRNQDRETTPKVTVPITPKKPSPKVTVHILPEEDARSGNEVTLVCLVSCPVQQNYNISWTEDISQNNGNYVSGTDFPQQKFRNGFLVTSVYYTTAEKWKTHTFGCVVWAAGSEDPTIRNVSKAQDLSTKSPNNKSLKLDTVSTNETYVNCLDTIAEDEFSSLWSTASSFIFLFISSLLYNMIISLVKMRNQ